MPEEKTPSPAPDVIGEKIDENFEKTDQPENLTTSDPQQIDEENQPSEEVVSQTEKDPDQEQKPPLPHNLDFILDIPLEISVELGRSRKRIADILKLGQGSIIELNNPAGNSLEVLVNRKPIAKGEVVVVNEKYAIRLIEILSVMERIEKLK